MALTAGGLFAILIVTLVLPAPASPVSVWGGMLRFDWLAFVFKMIFIFAAAITALLVMDMEKLGDRARSTCCSWPR